MYSLDENDLPDNNLNSPFKITPWEVEGNIDYNKLIERFGTQKITDDLLNKIKQLTGEIHPLLRNLYFYSHRDLDWILSQYEKGNKFYLYTGRGPSGMVHLGHLLPWFFTKYLQDKFNAKLIFQITDDEKFLYGDKRKKEIEHFTYENLLDIISIGFDPKKTKIIIDTKHINYLYPVSLEISKMITFSTAKAVFGFNNSTSIGMINFPSIQAAPCFIPSVLENTPVPVLIPAAIDQDPYWRMTRDIAEKMNFYKPAQIHSQFLPGLINSAKMSSSKPETAIFTTDDENTVTKKVKHAFTGGQPTISLQRKLGGNASGCPVFWYLKYFFDSERQSNERFINCISGNLLCGECKSNLLDSSTHLIREIKLRREKAKDKIKDYMIDQKLPDFDIEHDR